MSVDQRMPSTVERQRYLRPLKLGIALSMLGELGLFVVFGLVLSPSGNLIHKFLWTVVFCGIGMGAAGGAFLDLFVVDRWRGWPAVLASTLISVALLGIACNLLCLSLDMDLDHFGGKSNPALFLASGILAAALGGAFLGWLLFTGRGVRVLDRLGV